MSEKNGCLAPHRIKRAPSRDRKDPAYKGGSFEGVEFSFNLNVEVDDGLSICRGFQGEKGCILHSAT